MKKRVKDKRQAVLEATLELVNNSGFHASSMSKIAKLANVAPATIYLYFENKQDLVNKLYLHIKTEMSDCAFKNYDEKLSVEEGFKTIWYDWATYKRTHIKESMFLALCDISPMVDEPTRDKGILFFQQLLDLIKRGQREGIFKDYSPHLLYGFTITPLFYLIARQQDKSLSFDKTILDEAYEMAWNSIKKD